MSISKSVSVVVRPKRQVTLPRELCEKLKIGVGDVLEFSLKDSAPVAKPKKAAALEALRRIQEAFKRSGIVVSQLVLEEVLDVLENRMPAALSDFREVMLNSLPEVIESPAGEEIKRWGNVINIRDAPILASAVAARPDCLVAGDRHFFAPRVARESGLRIVTPSRFLEALKRRRDRAG